MKKFLQINAWIERATEFDSLAAMRSYAIMLIAFLSGATLTYVMAFVWQPAALIVLVGAPISAMLMLPYCLGLLWRISDFNAERGSWLALLSALI